MLWCRLYKEFATDPKVQRLPESMQRRLIMLMCLHIDNEINHLTDDDLSFILKISKTALQKTKTALQRFLTDSSGWKLAKWDERQFSSDSSKARVARYREKVKQACNVTDTLQTRYGNSLDTDTDTDTKKERESKVDTLGDSISVVDRGELKTVNVMKEFADYIKPLSKFFVITPTDRWTIEMFYAWRERNVITADVEAVVEENQQKLKEGDIKTPQSLKSYAINYAAFRLRGDAYPRKMSPEDKTQRMIDGAIKLWEKQNATS